MLIYLALISNEKQQNLSQNKNDKHLIDPLGQSLINNYCDWKALDQREQVGSKVGFKKNLYSLINHKFHYQRKSQITPFQISNTQFDCMKFCQPIYARKIIQISLSRGLRKQVSQIIRNQIKGSILAQFIHKSIKLREDLHQFEEKVIKIVDSYNNTLFINLFRVIEKFQIMTADNLSLQQKKKLQWYFRQLFRKQMKILLDYQTLNHSLCAQFVEFDSTIQISDNSIINNIILQQVQISYGSTRGNEKASSKMRNFKDHIPLNNFGAKQELVKIIGYIIKRLQFMIKRNVKVDIMIIYNIYDYQQLIKIKDDVQKNMRSTHGEDVVKQLQSEKEKEQYIIKFRSHLNDRSLTTFLVQKKS
ncbi:hypothetical protein pb186bvf_001890 [Paramecium bursaria]